MRLQQFLKIASLYLTFGWMIKISSFDLKEIFFVVLSFFSVTTWRSAIFFWLNMRWDSLFRAPFLFWSILMGRFYLLASSAK